MARLPDQAAAYDALVEPIEPLPIGELPTKWWSRPKNLAEMTDHRVRLLSLDGGWF
jgi:hypothetical protein